MARPTKQEQLRNRQRAGVAAQLNLALDNMPGALVYTDDELNIVFCNDRFRDMYPAPAALLRPGRPYAEFLRFLAEHGYYGPGDADAQVAKRVDSLRNPSNKTFEDRTPDGRGYQVRRRRVDAGGVGTVMTEITEQKAATQALAHTETQIHLA
ncbi:MAG: PAS-domain containing protein, partial [Alphaproteobacteria bacterium]